VRLRQSRRATTERTQDPRPRRLADVVALRAHGLTGTPRDPDSWTRATNCPCRLPLVSHRLRGRRCLNRACPRLCLPWRRRLPRGSKHGPHVPTFVRFVRWPHARARESIGRWRLASRCQHKFQDLVHADEAERQANLVSSKDAQGSVVCSSEDLENQSCGVERDLEIRPDACPVLSVPLPPVEYPEALVGQELDQGDLHSLRASAVSRVDEGPQVALVNPSRSVPGCVAVRHARNVCERPDTPWITQRGPFSYNL
jgi:hypothetical protein